MEPSRTRPSLAGIGTSGDLSRAVDDAAHGALDATFNAVAEEPVEDDGTLEVLGRDMRCPRAEGRGVRIRCLCDGPRGAADYIEIAREFHTVLLEGVPVLGKMDNDRAIRFIMMVDEFYDRSVNLVIAAELSPRRSTLATSMLLRLSELSVDWSKCSPRSICASRTSPDLDLNQQVL